jgi:hypothetical protein
VIGALSRLGEGLGSAAHLIEDRRFCDTRCGPLPVEVSGNMFRSSILSLILVALLGDPTLANVQSTFDDDAEGWIVRDVDCSNYAQTNVTQTLAWQPTGGDPDGHVVHSDVTSFCSFFSAPSPYLGDMSAYAGGTLSFSLSSTESDWQGSDVVVLIGAGRVLCWRLPQLPPLPPSWRTYEVPLEASVFRYDNSAGSVVSEADFAAVLANLSALLLPAEFGAIIEETVLLDSVHLRTATTSAPTVPHAALRLIGAQPNPFNPATSIVFELADARPVRLAIYDTAGRLVSVLREGWIAGAGRHSLVWHGHDDEGNMQASGVYTVRLQAAGESATARIVLVR